MRCDRSAGRQRLRAVGSEEWFLGAKCWAQIASPAFSDVHGLSGDAALKWPKPTFHPLIGPNGPLVGGKVRLQANPWSFRVSRL